MQLSINQFLKNMDSDNLCGLKKFKNYWIFKKSNVDDSIII